MKRRRPRRASSVEAEGEDAGEGLAEDEERMKMGPRTAKMPKTTHIGGETVEDGASGEAEETLTGGEVDGAFETAEGRGTVDVSGRTTGHGRRDGARGGVRGGSGTGGWGVLSSMSALRTAE